MSANLSDTVQINDLFEASYLVCRGYQIQGMTVKKGKGREIVSFIFEGKDAKSESNKFKMGHATANVCMLKVSMKHLKDLLFQRLREPEIGEQHDTKTKTWE